MLLDTGTPPKTYPQVVASLVLRLGFVAINFGILEKKQRLVRTEHTLETPQRTTSGDVWMARYITPYCYFDVVSFNMSSIKCVFYFVFVESFAVACVVTASFAVAHTCCCVFAFQQRTWQKPTENELPHLAMHRQWSSLPSGCPQAPGCTKHGAEGIWLVIETKMPENTASKKLLISSNRLYHRQPPGFLRPSVHENPRDTLPCQMRFPPDIVFQHAWSDHIVT